MARFAVFASGTGSNFVAIHDFFAGRSGATDGDSRHDSGHNHVPACLVCDNPQAPVVAKAMDRGVPVIHAQYRRGNDRVTTETAVLGALKAAAVEFVVLAGYMRVLTPLLVDTFARRIVNIHPSLLPDFPGTDAIQRAYSAGVAVFGITVHYVDHGIDTGPVILQVSLDADRGETLAERERRVHALEHEWYPKVLARLFDAAGGHKQ